MLLGRVVLACLFAVLPVVAQEVTATIAGRVLDATGALIAGAAITVTNVETNQSIKTVSEPTGNFLTPLLRPGRYRLTVSMPGFRTFEQSGITLEIGQRLAIDVPLQVGATEERVEVTAELPTITTESATVSKVIDHKSITQIPLNGRLNIVGLMALAPGIQNAGSQDGLPTFGITPTVAGGSNTGSVAFSVRLRGQIIGNLFIDDPLLHGAEQLLGFGKRQPDPSGRQEQRSRHVTSSVVCASPASDSMISCNRNFMRSLPSFYCHRHSSLSVAYCRKRRLTLRRSNLSNVSHC